MAFELNPKIKIVLDPEGDNLLHIFRVPNPDEWIKYNSMRFKGAKSTIRRGEGSEISVDLSDPSTFEAAEFLWNACCLNVEGYLYNGEPVNAETEKWQEKIFLPHKVASIGKFVELIDKAKDVIEKN